MEDDQRFMVEMMLCVRIVLRLRDVHCMHALPLLHIRTGLNLHQRMTFGVEYNCVNYD
jgi:hypothetical protein